MSSESVNPRRPLWHWALLAGVGIGVAYTLSPLSTLTLAASPLIWQWASRDLSPRERRWLAIVLGVAVAIRLAAMAALFLSAPASVPYANFFGDEELFKRRSVWIRNIGLGVSVHPADVIYAYDDVGKSLHLFVLAFMQAVVGNAPYGILMCDAAVYLVGVLLMYRTVRPAFGGVAAMGGLALLLYLPSLFLWSISALKEPAYMCVAVIGLVSATVVARGPSLLHRMGGVAGVGVCAVVLASLRDGGMPVALASVAGGLVLAALAARPRVMLTAALLAPLLVVLAFKTPSVQMKAMAAVQQAAGKNWGMIYTPGYTYKLLDYPIYATRARLDTLTPPEAGRFVVRAVGAYLTMPLPWRIESKAALAFLPELMVWYGLVVLAPVGFVAGLRRAPVLASLLATHAVVAAAIVALTGGNIGTLVRHRGLALPYLVWLSTLGACHLAGLLVARTPSATGAEPETV